MKKEKESWLCDGDIISLNPDEECFIRKVEVIIIVGIALLSWLLILYAKLEEGRGDVDSAVLLYSTDIALSITFVGIWAWKLITDFIDWIRWRNRSVLLNRVNKYMMQYYNTTLDDLLCELEEETGKEYCILIDKKIGGDENV